MSRDADLSTYRAERDFERTSEPSDGGSGQGGGGRQVPMAQALERGHEEVADQEADR